MEAKLPVVGWDADDVLVYCHRPATLIYNDIYGANLPLNSKRYFHADDMGLDWPEASRRISHVIHGTGASRTFQPIPESQEDLLQYGHLTENHVITARQAVHREVTEQNIAEHYPGVFEGVHLANHFATEGVQKSKLEICVEIGAIAMVDDQGHNLWDAAEEGMLGFLHGEHPYNRAVLSHPNIFEVHRPREVWETLGKLKVIEFQPSWA